MSSALESNVLGSCDVVTLAENAFEAWRGHDGHDGHGYGYGHWRSRKSENKSGENRRALRMQERARFSALSRKS
ncbi:MAG: hypothetical protein IPJ71_09065 [Bdellovibrionales bacterium]|nr:hypothetical protein [Bdellovibrionales bacterium]